MSEELLSQEEIEALLAEVNASKEKQPVKPEAAGSVSPVVVEESNEQNANPDNNEMQEFLDSQTELIASGKAYIDDLVTNESTEIPQFNDSMFRSKLYGESCTRNSQVTALEKKYEEYIKDKYQKNTEEQTNLTNGRAHKIKLRVYDAARAVEDQINLSQEKPLSEAELQKGIKENITLYLRDQDVDVLRDPDMLKACLLLREGFTDLDLKNHLGVLDEVLKDPLFVAQAVLIKEAVAEGAAILVSKEEEPSSQEIQSNVPEKKTEKEIVVEEGTQFPDADGDITWVVEKIEGDRVFIKPVGIDTADFKSKEVDLSELKERLKVIEAEKVQAESINKDLVNDYETFRGKHNEIIDKRFEGKGRVKKMLGGFFRNSSARVAIGMIIGVSSSLTLGANPLASPMVAGVRMLTRNALSVFGFGTGNKARAIGNEQARVIKTLEFGLSADIKRPGQEGFDEAVYNQALVENYKNISNPEEKAKMLATLVEIADKKGQKIDTDEYNKQVESIRNTKERLADKHGTLARFDEYREKFSKMSTKKKILMSAAIALVSIGGATAVGVATGATLTTGLGTLALLKSVGLASGTIGGMLTSGTIGMASGAIMSNPEKTTDYSENSALVDALGKEYFSSNGTDEEFGKYYKEINNKFNMALAKGVGVGLVFANAMAIFGLTKDALDHFKGHGANGGDEVTPVATGKLVTTEPTSAGKTAQETVPVTGSTKPFVPEQTEPAPLSSGVKIPAEMPHELSKNEFDAKVASFGANSQNLNAEKALAGGSLEGKNASHFMDKVYDGLKVKDGLPVGAENHDQVVQQMTEKAKEMGIINANNNFTDKIDAPEFNPQKFTDAVVNNDNNYFNTLNHDLSTYDQSHVASHLSTESAISNAQRDAEPAVPASADRQAGSLHAQQEVSNSDHIDKEVASKINQANIDPAGKSFEKATPLTLNQVDKMIDSKSENKYVDGWFGGFLRRGIEHGHLKEGDFRVMFDKSGHPQLKVDLSHFPSQERTGINSNYLGIGLKGIPENAGIESVYKERPWWDFRSNFIKVNTEDAVADKTTPGTAAKMPAPIEHPKVDIASEIKQNSTDGNIHIKTEDVDPNAKTDFPNSSTGQSTTEHGTVPETKASAGTAIPESAIPNKIEPGHLDASYWKSSEGLAQLNNNAEIKDAGIFNIKGPIFDLDGKLKDADFSFKTSDLPPDLAQATAGMTGDQRLNALHNYYLNTIRDQIETK